MFHGRPHSPLTFLATAITLARAALNSSVVLISKRRGQYPQAIVKSVRACMEYLDDAPDLDTRLSLIDTLRLVCEGKVWRVCGWRRGRLGLFHGLWLSFASP